MSRQTLAFHADVAEGTAVAGFLSQLSLSIGTNSHLEPVIKAAHAVMSTDFDIEIGKFASDNIESLHHVYEWGRVGDPKSRLWRNVLRGRGAKQTATFEWRASVSTVPTPNPPIPKGKTGKQLQQIHTFVWKAPVMEYDMRVHIARKKSNALAFATGDSSNPLWFTRSSQSFRPGRYQMANGESRIRGQASGHTAGQFTKAYIGWWGGPSADASFDRGVRKKLEMDFKTLPITKTALRYRRPPMKTFSLNVGTDAKAAYAFGVEQAEKWLVNRDKNYYAIASARKKRV